MCDAPIDFPPVAAGFQRIGWHGLALVVPEAWNLRLHEGTARAGAIFFSDLRATRLEVRWRTQRNPAALAASLARLRKSAASHIEELSPTALRIRHKSAISLTAIDGRRLYEIHWPAPAEKGAAIDPTLVTAITDDFLETVRLIDGRPLWYWSVYGSAGWVPAGARLAKASLLPGASTLSFTKGRYGGKFITLGALSMADRLLAGAGSLRRWATSAIPLVARHPGGQWEESPRVAIFTAEARRLFGLAQHELLLRHDIAANRITWMYRLQPTCR